MGGWWSDEVGSQDESSEEFLGEWMEVRGVRDQMVIATKVCSSPVFRVMHKS